MNNSLRPHPSTSESCQRWKATSFPFLSDFNLNILLSWRIQFQSVIDFFFLFVCLQDSISALARDLNYPPLRKNKNIDAFLNRCKSQQLFAREVH